MASLTVSSDYTVADQLRMTKATRYFAWQSAMAKAALGRRVLEIGCGLGNFTEHLRDRECVVGVDVDEACIARHRERFAQAPHIEAFVMDALDPALVELKSRRLDSVACLNVLEHIEHDVALLRSMGQVLPSGGRIVLMVPAFPALYGPIDRELGHYRRYTPASMRATGAEAGLKVRQLRFMNTVGFFGWWVNAHVLRKTEQSEGQIVFFDRVVVPLISRLETAIPPPFGQSLFAVLEKH